MNRYALAEATSLHEGPVPVSLMETIANSTKVNNRHAEKAADYILGRLNKSNLNVKLKALQIILFCIQEGSSAFVDAIKEDEQEISAYLQYSGPSDAEHGDEKYRRIRVASQEVLTCLHDAYLSRRKEKPPQQEQQPLQGATNSWQMPLGDNRMSSSNCNAACNQGQLGGQGSSIGMSSGHLVASGRPVSDQENPFSGCNGMLAGYDGSTGELCNPFSGGCNGERVDYNASAGPCDGPSSNGDCDYHDSDKQTRGCVSHQKLAQGGSGPNAPPQQQKSGLDRESISSGSGHASKTCSASTWELIGDCVKDDEETRKDIEPNLAGSDVNDALHQRQVLPRSRRLSYGPSSRGDYTLEKDLHGINEQLQRVLALCETQRENPLQLQAKIDDLQKQLRQAVAEKNYWMKRCKDLASHHSTTAEGTSVDLQRAKSCSRKRTNSELIFIADTWAQPGRGRILSEGTSCFVDSDVSVNCSEPELAKDMIAQRSIFQLLQCSDEQCEVFVPKNRSICTQHRSRNNVQLMWDVPPKTVLVVKKPNESETTDMLVRLTSWLHKDKNIDVFLEPSVYEELALPNTKTWGSKLQDWVDCQKKIDFVISLGGDGTVLWVSSLFSKSVPPVFSLAMGSLGFLTPFDAENAVEHLTGVINGGFYMSLRSRLSCTIYRNNKKRVIKGNLHALNEIVIDRGPSGALVELNCYCDGLKVTNIAADGIIIATPTGSTAYSLSAGGSMAHPSVPSMLFTPICPHTLSFRPLIFHDSATLKIEFPSSSRASACYVSFDGKDRLRLERGDSIVVRVSSYPLPSICRVNENQDWFESMITNLNWNQRRAQKPWQPSVTSKM